MEYMSQSSTVGYMAQSALETIVSPAPAPTYNAVVPMLQSNNINGLSYASEISSGFSYSSDMFSLPSNVPQDLGMNSSYLSNIMEEYGASLTAVRGIESSFDLMSASSSSLTHVETNFSPNEFIKPKAGGIFVGDALQIEKEIKETFEKLMGEEFPDDIKVSVLSASSFRKICPQPGVLGVSFNRRRLGLISEIFVKEGSLASVMLTIGHEIGHVLTSTLEDAALEEAKAYSFSFAWMKTIKQLDIAGLGGSFVSTLPAANGIHDKGYYFVRKLLGLGKGAFSVYRKLVMHELTVKDLPCCG